MSETPKFTPGPWTYRPNELDDWGVVKSGKYVLCQVRDPRLSSDDISDHRNAGTDPYEANACLVAAGPELYAALEVVRDADEDCKRDGLPTMPEFVRARIDAAIAKAEGRT